VGYSKDFLRLLANFALTAVLGLLSLVVIIAFIVGVVILVGGPEILDMLNTIPPSL
jgi:type IV secretory pathway VirB2 component (pilin)